MVKIWTGSGSDEVNLLRQPLWTPSHQRVKESNLIAFIASVNQRYGLGLETYPHLLKWSVEAIPEFWAAMWEFGGIKFSKPYTEVVDDIRKFPGAKWFLGAQLNFAENLLRFRNDKLAFVFRGETRRESQISYAGLYDRVGRLSASLRRIGVRPGDVVCAYMPNLIETAIAMLAATSVGAVWASCGAELGPTAVLDRFEQISPKVLFTADGYFYKDQLFDSTEQARKVVEGIPSIEKVLVVPYASAQSASELIPRAEAFDDFLSSENPGDIRFEQLPFDHPVYIMFSSGTTGKPKCMVQGPGVLLNHLKELLLHSDLKQNDRITYISSPSWMMWNWLMSSLAVGSTIVLYDGNPNYPDWGTMWRLVQDQAINIFGCSASYINYLRSVAAKPGQTYDLSALKEISQTGSPLSTEGFQWVYNEIKRDLHFNSISGGTDINGCFAGGSPTLPVYAGELQAAGLAMKVAAYDENGNSILDREGELVCEAPSPSMPLFFWNDPANEKYRDAYFTYYSNVGKNVWRHGDYIIIHSDTGGITFLGRSDSVLKPSGVRIGTGEIYHVLEQFQEIADSLVVGQDWKDDQRVILFVQLASGQELTEGLKARIRKALRDNASPRHVPALILAAPSFPYTFNMKKVESAVRNIVNGRPVPNKDALGNPESLDYFERVASDLRKMS
jgi:acetoacetyl-CoA synthetase